MKITAEKSIDPILATVFAISFGFALGPILRGLVLVKLWTWFLVQPLGVRPIDIPTSLGIALLLKFATYRGAESKKDEEDEETLGYKCRKLFEEAIIGPLFTLLAGAIVHYFQ